MSGFAMGCHSKHICMSANKAKAISCSCVVTTVDIPQPREQLNQSLLLRHLFAETYCGTAKCFALSLNNVV